MQRGPLERVIPLPCRFVTIASGRWGLIFVNTSRAMELIAALGGPVFPDLEDSDYDNLFLVTICGSQAKLHTLRVDVPEAASPQ